MVEVLLDGSADIEVYLNILEFLFDESTGFNLLYFEVADAEGCRPLHHAAR